jgi:hypothetical protein
MRNDSIAPTRETARTTPAFWSRPQARTKNPNAIGIQIAADNEEKTLGVMWGPIRFYSG